MSIEGRISDIEFDLAERTKTLGQIARDNKFTDTGDMGRWLVRFRHNDLWRRLQLYGGQQPEVPKKQAPRKAEPVRDRASITHQEYAGTVVGRALQDAEPGQELFIVDSKHQAILEESGIVHLVEEDPKQAELEEALRDAVTDDPWTGPPPWEEEEPDIAGTREEHLEDLLENHPAPPTPSPIREEPVMAQEAPEAPIEAPPTPPADKSGYKLASGATEHRDGRAITYGERVWSYLEAALKSPKKRTAAKATRLQQQFYELIDLVDEEAEEVKALTRIAELEAELAKEREKLRPRTTSSVPDPTPADGHGRVPGSKIRVWAREQGIEVPDQGKISNDLRARYEAAHDEDEGLNDE